MDEAENLDTFERYFYLINGFIGAALNAIVLLIGLLKVDTADKPRQIIVISMTLADLLTCLFYMLTRPYNCLCLLWINVDKLIFIGRPLHYYQLVKRDRVLILIALSWLCLISLVITLYSFMEIKHPCDSVELSAKTYLFICLLYVSTITVSFIVSAIIYCIARNSTRIRSTAYATRSRLFKQLFFVFSSTAWTFATCLPYRLLYLGITFLYKGSRPSPLIGLLINISYYLLVIGIVVNPLITIVTQRLYRYWLTRFWWWMAAWLGLSQKIGTAQRNNSTLVSFTDRRHSEHLLYSKCAIANAEHGTRRPNSRSITINANDLYEGTRSKSAKNWRTKTGKSAARLTQSLKVATDKGTVQEKRQNRQEF
ncbi:hypothetical protein niasHS_006054 [Heterodera schachtii]|uniref:G-protein coupled receptors family 1 profile domain-containing protein n=1 Tax=Heterodera schachtii TaxID=97005 RepID=A0ABD2JW22_HETSC